MRKSYPNLIAYARGMRGSMTAAEALLWKELRRRKYGKWRRQHPVAGYVLDFYCPGKRLCVEVDGEIHETERQHQRDVERTAKLTVLGIRVLRFRNREVLDDAEMILARIHQSITAAPDPLPPAGEGGARQRAG